MTLSANSWSKWYLYDYRHFWKCLHSYHSVNLWVQIKIHKQIMIIYWRRMEQHFCNKLLIISHSFLHLYLRFPVELSRTFACRWSICTSTNTRALSSWLRTCTWTWRLVPGQKNVQRNALVDSKLFLLPPLHINLRLMKQFAKA